MATTPLTDLLTISTIVRLDSSTSVLLRFWGTFAHCWLVIQLGRFRGHKSGILPHRRKFLVGRSDLASIIASSSMIQLLAAKATLLSQRPLVISRGVLFLNTFSGYFLNRNLGYLSSLELAQVNKCPRPTQQHHQLVNDTAYLVFIRSTSLLDSILVQ